MSLRWSLLLAVLFVFACGPDRAARTETGGVAIVGKLGAALTASSVDRIEVVVSHAGSGLRRSALLTKDTGDWTGRVADLPVDTGYEVSATAYAVDLALFTAAAYGVTISFAQDTLVTLAFHPVSFPPSFYNRAPIIESLTATKRDVDPDETIDVAASAVDPDDGDSVYYTWTADAGSFVGDPLQSNVRWKAPPGPTRVPARLTVRVDDHRGASSVGYILINPATGAIAFTTRFFEAPRITAMTVTGTPRPGKTLTASVTIEGGSDEACTPDDPLCIGSAASSELRWSTDCDGSSATEAWTPGVASWTFTVTSTATTCAVHALVTDRVLATMLGTTELQLGQPSVTCPAGGCGMTRIFVGGAPQAARLSADGATLYVPNYPAPRIDVIDVATSTIARTIATRAPADLALAPDGMTGYLAYGYDQGLREVTRIDLASGAETGNLPVDTTWGSSPITMNHAGTKLYAALYPFGALTEIDLGTFTVTAQYGADVYDNELFVSRDDTQLWIRNVETGNQGMRRIDLATGTSSRIEVPGSSPSAAFAPDGSTAYVCGASPTGGLVVSDVALTGAVLASTTLPGASEIYCYVNVTPDGRRLVVSSMSGRILVLDAHTKAILLQWLEGSAADSAVTNTRAFVVAGDHVAVVPIP